MPRRFEKNFTSLTLVVALLLGLLADGFQVGEARAAGPTMRQKVYEKLSKAQEATEAGEYDRVYDLLEQVENMKNLSANEAAQLYTAYGYAYFSQERYAESAAAYEKVLAQEELAEATRIGTLYTLGQLHFHLENYDKALQFLGEWLEVAENPGPEAFILMGQAYYQTGRLEKAAAPVRRAIAIAEERDRTVQENWYGLLRVIYFETGDYDRLLEVLEVLVSRWPAKEYWLHLASAYGEMGDPRKQLAAYEMAHAQGYLQKSAELVLLAQLLLQAEVPYRAGLILQEGLDSGAVESTAANWRLLSQAWILAQEHEAAINSLRRAAELSDDGELYVCIAQSFANLGRWEEAAQAAAKAIEMGVDDPHELHMMRGMAFFELGRFEEARAAFSRAQRSPEGRAAASKWLAYVEREQQRLRELGVQ